MVIGVFFGGKSPEHDISIITGQLIISGLKGLEYSVVPIYISKDGTWYSDDQLASIKFFQDENYQAKLKGLDNWSLDLNVASGKMNLRKKGLLAKSITIDFAFPALHGPNGEDGLIQGVFEACNMPYVGCDITASGVAIDKVLTKQFCQGIGVPTAKFVHFSKNDWLQNKQVILDQIHKELPNLLIVKPARLGSSIGITKVHDEKELENAVEVALHYDNKVLVEECIQNLMDITCSLIGNENPRASLLQESSFEDDLFSYDEKYLNDGGAQTGKALKNLHIPARIDEKLTSEIQQTASKVFKELDCRGIARVDFLLDTKTKKYYVTEINPLPGTLYHHLWEKSGMPLDKVISELISLAKENYEAKSQITLTFDSPLLVQSKSSKLQLKKSS